MLRFKTLRWRIATFYALLLIVVIPLAAFVRTFEVRRILLDGAQAKVDTIGVDIARVAKRDSALSASGDSFSVLNELTTPGNLEHWASPSRYSEIDTPQGYPIGKSTDMGSATLGPSPTTRRSSVVYCVANAPLGEVFVRDELIRYPGVALIVKVGESLNLYYEILGRIRELLALVVFLSAVLVALGSEALFAGGVEAVGRPLAPLGE